MKQGNARQQQVWPSPAGAEGRHWMDGWMSKTRGMCGITDHVAILRSPFGDNLFDSTSLRSAVRLSLKSGLGATLGRSSDLTLNHHRKRHQYSFLLSPYLYRMHHDPFQLSPLNSQPGRPK